MRYIFLLFFIAVSLFVFGFRKKHADKIVNNNEVVTVSVITDTIAKANTSNVTSKQALHFVEYAKALVGTPYLYGSTDPAKGLDCSGFINSVSKHFGIIVPRSSIEFTTVGTEIATDSSLPGDLILFTGTDPKKHVVGHIGIITENNKGDIQFIHSSSGKANGVTVSDLEGYYETRFVKIIRIFQEDKVDV